MTTKHAQKYKLISKAIKEARKNKNISQKQLADNLGISKSYISKIEAPNCDKPFSLELIFDIAEFLNLPLSEFFKYVKD